MVGVPDKVPFDARVRPGGRDPLATAKLTPPPLAENTYPAYAVFADAEVGGFAAVNAGVA